MVRRSPHLFLPFSGIYTLDLDMQDDSKVYVILHFVVP